MGRAVAASGKAVEVAMFQSIGAMGKVIILGSALGIENITIRVVRIGDENGGAAKRFGNRMAAIDRHFAAGRTNCGARLQHRAQSRSRQVAEIVLTGGIHSASSICAAIPRGNRVAIARRLLSAK